jgi:uncharacterized membrane protein YjgN (DUF898 family)
MKRGLVTQIMLVCLLALSLLMGISCTSFKVSGLEVVQQPSAGDILGYFDIDVKITKFLGYSAGPTLGNIKADATDPAIVDAIKAEVAKFGGSKATNVKIEYKASFINILLNSITWGIYSPAFAHVTGAVIK